MTDHPLKTCPFCGSPARLAGEPMGGRWVDCTGCDASVGYLGTHDAGESVGRYTDEAEAAAYWNRRVTPIGEPEP